MKVKDSIHFILFFLIIVFLSFIMIDSYYPNGNFIMGYDTYFHLERFNSLHQSLKHNTYPFYIDTEIFGGYGYATNLFYPDLALLPFTFFIDSIGLINSYKLLIFSFTIITALISYLCSKKMFKSKHIAYVFTLLYTFALYRLTNMSIRNALAEMLAQAFIPIVFWGAYEIIIGNYKRYWYIISIGFTLLICTHLISSFIIFIFLIISLIIYLKTIINEPKRLMYLLYAGIFSIFLSSAFLFPLLEQIMDNTFYYKTKPQVSIISDKSVPWRWVIDGMLTGLVIAGQRIPDVGIILSGSLAVRIFIKKQEKIIKIADISSIVGFILLFAITIFFPWHLFPFKELKIIQFPWRLVGVITFLFACSGSIYLCYLVPSKKHFYVLLSAIIIITAISLKITSSNFHEWKFDILSSNNYNVNSYNSAGCNEYIPSSVPSIDYIKERGNLTITSKEDILVNDLKKEKSLLSFNYESTSTNVNATLPLLYYKGYTATLDGKEINVQQSNDGLVQITMPNSGNIKVWYHGTLIQRISFVISIISLLGLIFYIFYTNRKTKSLK